MFGIFSNSRIFSMFGIFSISRIFSKFGIFSISRIFSMSGIFSFSRIFSIYIYKDRFIHSSWMVMAEQNTSYGLILRQDTCSCDVEPWKRVYGGQNLSKISRKWFSKNSCWHEKKIHANMKKKFMTWKKNSCHEIADAQPQ